MLFTSAVALFVSREGHSWARICAKITDDLLRNLCFTPDNLKYEKKVRCSAFVFHITPD